MCLVRTSSIWGLGLAISLSAASAGLAAPPRPASEGRTIGGAIVQPFRDLNLVRETLPAPLVEAGKSPYAPPADCAAAAAELARLTDALGPDVDTADGGEGGFSGEAVIAGAVRSAIGLPFRGVVRRLTGAEKRDETFRTAVLAGMVRRGYLKGARSQMACDAAPVLTQAAAPAPPAPAAETFATEVSDRAPESLATPPEEVHDRGEVADVDGLVQQGGADEAIIGQGPVAGGENEGHLLLTESGR